MNRIVDWVKSLRVHFVDDCKSWWKMWSSWLAVLWGLVVTVFWTDPTLLGQLMNAMTPNTRALLSPLVMGSVTALPIIVRMLKQRKLEAAEKEKARAIAEQHQ